jgi:hypothetical protein
MNPFTVTWDDDARNELTRLWLNNPHVRSEITAASDEIDRLLAIRPLELGVEQAPNVRQYVEPPLKVLFRVSEADRLVRVLYVKHLFD